MDDGGATVEMGGRRRDGGGAVDGGIVDGGIGGRRHDRVESSRGGMFRGWKQSRVKTVGEWCQERQRSTDGRSRAST